MIRVSIIGATGYTGGELLRYLIRHPEVKLAHLTSENFAGQPIHTLHKFLKGRCSLICEKINIAAIVQNSDLVFLCLPHGASATTAAAIRSKEIKVIDLSADFRLQNLAIYTRWYGKHLAPKLIKEAVYGLPERYRDQIRQAKLVAAPGCYATTAILAGLPLAAKGLLGPGEIIVDAKSGITGAGRKVEATYLYSEANESLQAYGLKGHRHHPEILQEWQRAAADAKQKSKIEMVFVPHLVPMNRGIFVTLYAPLAKRISVDALREAYVNYYLRQPFVTVLGAQESPEIKAVVYTNQCQIGVSIDPAGKRAVIMAATDNLGKGASGQAVQCMNLMFGLEESVGLL